MACSAGVEFELNVVIVLAGGELITENFPLKLVRYSRPGLDEDLS
jgi:hypothetical protein